MTYDEVLAQTREIIEAHYKKHRTAKRPTADTILKWLKQEHGDPEALSLLGRSDLERRHLPTDLACDIVRFWRRCERQQNKHVDVVVDLGPDAEAGRLDPGQLVGKYDPDLQPDAFGKRLGAIATTYTHGAEQSPKFLIFDDNAAPAIDKKLTRKELGHLKGTGVGRDVAIYDGNPYETFAVGNQPVQYAEQSPWDWQEVLYQGESNAGVPWGKLPPETRQLVFIASAMVKEPDLQKFTELQLFNLLAAAEMKGKSFSLGGQLFPKSFIQFKQYKRQGHLPAMKVAIGQHPGSGTT